MIMNATKSAVGFAAAAALIALSGATVSSPVFAKGAAAKVAPCYGVNSCKGQSDCKSGNHECKGMNDCKGQGFKDLSAKACKAQHGSLTPPAN
jgi:uncharacterized membrane protein